MSNTPGLSSKNAAVEQPAETTGISMSKKNKNIVPIIFTAFAVVFFIAVSSYYIFVKNRKVEESLTRQLNLRSHLI